LSIEIIISALKELRVNAVFEEYELQDEIAKILKSHNISFIKEHKLGPRNRIDFFIDKGIGIEIKKGKPNRTKVIKQLERYASFNEISALILVIERSMDIPRYINNKPCLSIGLNKQWGIAI
jgi:hypothetical protein